METYESDLFTVSNHSDHVTLVAEASDLGISNGAIEFAILSRKTGNTVRFRFRSTDYNGEDIAGWRFDPVPADVANLATKVDVLIIND